MDAAHTVASDIAAPQQPHGSNSALALASSEKKQAPSHPPAFSVLPDSSFSSAPSASATPLPTTPAPSQEQQQQQHSVEMNRIPVAFLGLGAMGFPMAGHLAQSKAVANCVVWNRTHKVALDHAQKYASRPVQHIAQWSSLTPPPELIFTCLPTSTEVRSIVDQLTPHLQPGCILVDCTSGNPRETREIAQILKEHQVDMLDAAVSGGPAGAQAGQLSVIVGGDASVLSRAAPALKSFAKAVTHVGPIGAGHAVKAMNNILNTSHLILAAEAAAALSRMGIDPEKAFEAINHSSGRSLATQQRLPEQVLTRKFAYGFKLGLMHKDVSIANQMLDDAFPSARMMRITQSLMDEAVESLGHTADYTEVCKVIEQKARTTLRPTATGYVKSTFAVPAMKQDVQQGHEAAPITVGDVEYPSRVVNSAEQQFASASQRL